MSGRKSSSSKITLGMLKGKSITTSVPSFAIRFHAEEEELEEIYPSPEDTDEDGEKQEEESSSSAAGAVTTSQTTVTTSTSATTSTLHSRDPSPMKEYLKGFGKRSTSVDAGMIDGGTSTSSSDTWRLFHEIKGKIAKTVEEKFGEIKSDKKSGSLPSSGGSSLRGGRLGGGGSKDDSSINSDSEDISESSSKGQETKSAMKKEKKEESSPKKTVMFPDKNKVKDGETTVVSQSLETPSSSQEKTSLSAPTTPKKTQVIISERSQSLRYRKSDKEFKNGFDKDNVLNETEIYHEDEVESGVEVDEKMNFDVADVDDLDIPTTDYRQPFPRTYPPLKHKQQRKPSLVSRMQCWGFKLLPYILILILFLIPFPPYISGFIHGIVISYMIYLVYSCITSQISLLAPHTMEEGGIQNNKEFSIPDYSKMPILEIPAAKEYHQANKYHGWMNEYRNEYDPETYRIGDTESVYIRLEGTVLRISHTKLRIPKRAMWNERQHKLKFYHQRIYDIKDCKLKLLPDGLTRRRLWSKKYPICIILQRYSRVKIEDIPDFPDKVEDEESSQSVLNGTSDLSSNMNTKFEVEEEDEDDDYHDTSEEKIISTKSDIPGLDESDDETFCHIDKLEMMERCLYLFARTDREKEDWYRRFASSLRKRPSPQSSEDKHVPEASSLSTSSSDNLIELSEKLTPSSSSLALGSGTSSIQSTASSSGQTFTLPTNEYMTIKSFEARDFEYLRFMSKFQQVQRYKMNSMLEKEMCAALNHVHLHSDPRVTPVAGKKHEKMETEIESEVDKEIDADVMWINALVGRVLFDILKNSFWLEKIQERLQRKLSTIKLPYFIEDLLITELDLGHNTPLAHRVSHPILDERGLWLDLDITYDGTTSFTLETKLNLMKLKQTGGEIAAQAATEKDDVYLGEKSKSPMYDSDVDDSAESSDDEDEGKSASGEEKPPGASTGKKFMNVVNKIASSKYFQQATEYKYIKKAMEEVSNTKLMLTVEINGLVGTLALNIPPPPSDRLWYGFRGNPRLWLQARPKFGERQVNISQVTSWIEKQLLQEFQKKFVLPNMDDLVIPPMTTELPD